MAQLFHADERSARWVLIRQVVQSDSERHGLYDQYDRLYRALYAETATTVHRLSALVRQASGS